MSISITYNKEGEGVTQVSHDDIYSARRVNIDNELDVFIKAGAPFGSMRFKPRQKNVPVVEGDFEKVTRSGVTGLIGDFSIRFADGTRIFGSANGQTLKEPDNHLTAN